LDGAGVAALLLTATAVTVTYTAPQLPVLAIAWLAVPLPGWWVVRFRGEGTTARLYTLHLVWGSLPTTAALLGLAWWEASAPGAALPRAAELPILAALLVGILA